MLQIFSGSIITAASILLALNSAQANEWREYSVVSSRLDEFPRLVKYEVGDTFSIMQDREKLRRSHPLLPGVDYGLPLVPAPFSVSKILSEVRATTDGGFFKETVGRMSWATSFFPADLKRKQLTSQFILTACLFSSCQQLYLAPITVGQFLPDFTSRWDLKASTPVGYSYIMSENAANFIYGLTGREMGFSNLTLNVAAGIVQRLTTGPYLSPGTFGDSPDGAVWSRMGQQYFDSGQLILDFLYDAQYSTSSESIAREALKIDPEDFAESEINRLYRMTADTDKMKKLKRQRRESTMAAIAAEKQAALLALYIEGQKQKVADEQRRSEKERQELDDQRRKRSEQDQQEMRERQKASDDATAAKRREEEEARDQARRKAEEERRRLSTQGGGGVYPGGGWSSGPSLSSNP